MDMLQRWQQRRRLKRAATHINHARRTGQGLHLQEWEHSFNDLCANGLDAIVDAVLEWCRQTLSGCRRPWGIDYFDLALALRLDGRAQPKSLSLRRLRPADLYDVGHLRHELATFLSPAAVMASAGTNERPHLAAAFFSWGNAADAAFAQA
jgi:hypothetical protein